MGKWALSYNASGSVYGHNLSGGQSGDRVHKLLDTEFHFQKFSQRKIYPMEMYSPDYISICLYFLLIIL